MIYVYGFTDPLGVTGHVLFPDAANPAHTTGIDDAPLAALNYGDVSAIISPTQSQRIATVDKNLWRHEEVLERLCSDRAVLPARFGTVLRDEQELRDVIAANERSFVANLARVRGKVELSARVLWDEERPAVVEQASSSGMSGQAYMLARLKEERELRAWRARGQALVDWIDAELAPLCSEHTQKMLTSPRMLLTAAYLVERAQVQRFHDRLAVLATGNPVVSSSAPDATGAGLRFMCTGPWPPYSFVDVNVSLPDRPAKSETL